MTAGRGRPYGRGPRHSFPSRHVAAPPTPAPPSPAVVPVTEPWVYEFDNRTVHVASNRRSYTASDRVQYATDNRRRYPEGFD